MLPLISIQIPTYNQADFLPRAIESCIDQTYTNLEIIIADDCSSDTTIEIVKKYLTDKRIKFYSNTTNIGRVANYKKVLYSYTTGQWILNLDGDDYFTNNYFIKNAVDTILKHGADKVLFYQGTHIYKTAETEKVIIPNIKGNEIALLSKDYIKNFFSINHFSHMSTLYNRHCAMEVEFYDKDIISADIYSLLKMSIKYPNKTIIISKEISGVWLQHGKNASKASSLYLHTKNYSLYQNLFLQQLRSPIFSTKDAYFWFLKSFYTYWRAWFSTKLKK